LSFDLPGLFSVLTAIFAVTFCSSFGLAFVGVLAKAESIVGFCFFEAPLALVSPRAMGKASKINK
jgi:hypothetical protein